MAVELAQGYLSLAVSAKGGGADLKKIFDGLKGDAAKAGQEAGAALRKGVESGSAGALKVLEAEYAKASVAAEVAGKRAKAAAEEQEAAARKIAIAEAKLAEVRASGTAKQSQLLAAEDRLAAARKNASTATLRVAAADEALKKAQDAAKASADKLASSTAAAERATSGLAGKIKSSLAGLKIPNVFDKLPAQAEKSGKDAGHRLATGISTAQAAVAGAAGGLAASAASAIMSAVGKVFTDGVAGAANLEQSVGAVQSVFGKYASQVDAASKTAATGLGLSQNSYNELATTLGAMVKNKGIPDFASRTQDLIKLGGDLAAQFGGSTKDAVEAIGAVMRGESDPIEKYGISISDAAIKAEMAAKGQSKLTGAALETAKAQARLALLTKQSGDAQGAFARETDTFAHKQQVFKASWENLSTSIGGIFLPILSKAMDFLSGTAMPALDKVKPILKLAADGFAAFMGAFTGQAPAGGSPALAMVIDAGTRAKSIFDGLKVWFEAELMPRLGAIGTIFQDLVGGMMTRLDPLMPRVQQIFGTIGQIITGALDLIKAAWDLWGDDIMDAVAFVFDSVLKVAEPALDVLSGLIKVAIDIIKGDWGAAWEHFQGVVKSALDAVKATFEAAWGAINGIAEKISGAISSISGGGSVSASVSTMSVGVGYRGGGYTGAMAPDKPAGTVHGDEWVIRSEAQRSIHAQYPGLLDFMNREGALPGSVVQARSAIAQAQKVLPSFDVADLRGSSSDADSALVRSAWGAEGGAESAGPSLRHVRAAALPAGGPRGGSDAALADAVGAALARHLPRMDVRLVGAVDRVADVIGAEIMLGYRGGV